MPRTERAPSEPTPGQEAYRHIVSDIRAGALKAGDRLVEAELAARFGISRTPVREAVRRLEGDGLVVHVARVGAAIRRLDHTEVSELYDMRAVFEASAARFAARAASDVELAELRDIHAELERASAVADHERVNRSFHRALYSAARNRWLLGAIGSVNDTLLILGPTTLNEPGRAEAAVAEHAAVLAALLARDQAAAETAMRRHIDAAHGARLRQIRALGGTDVP